MTATPTAHWDSTGTNQSMTLIASKMDAGKNNAVFIFGLVNPTPGAKTFSFTGTGIGEAHYYHFSFTGSDTTGGATTFPNTATNIGTTGTSLSAVLTSASGHYTVGATLSDATVSSFSGTSPNGYTQNVGPLVASGAGEVTGAASVTYSGTYTAGSVIILAALDIATPAAGTAIGLGTSPDISVPIKYFVGSLTNTLYGYPVPPLTVAGSPDIFQDAIFPFQRRNKLDFSEQHFAPFVAPPTLYGFPAPDVIKARPLEDLGLQPYDAPQPSSVFRLDTAPDIVKGQRWIDFPEQTDFVFIPPPATIYGPPPDVIKGQRWIDFPEQLDYQFAPVTVPGFPNLLQHQDVPYGRIGHLDLTQPLFALLVVPPVIYGFPPPDIIKARPLEDLGLQPYDAPQPVPVFRLGLSAEVIKAIRWVDFPEQLDYQFAPVVVPGFGNLLQHQDVPFARLTHLDLAEQHFAPFVQPVVITIVDWPDLIRRLPTPPDIPASVFAPLVAIVTIPAMTWPDLIRRQPSNLDVLLQGSCLGFVRGRFLAAWAAQANIVVGGVAT